MCLCTDWLPPLPLPLPLPLPTLHAELVSAWHLSLCTSEHLSFSLVWGCDGSLRSLYMTVMIQYSHRKLNNSVWREHLAGWQYHPFTVNWRSSSNVLLTHIYGDILLHVCHWFTYFWFFALVEYLFVITACIKCHYDPKYAENDFFPKIIVIGFYSTSEADLTGGLKSNQCCCEVHTPGDVRFKVYVLHFIWSSQPLSLKFDLVVRI